MSEHAYWCVRCSTWLTVGDPAHSGHEAIGVPDALILSVRAEQQETIDRLTKAAFELERIQLLARTLKLDDLLQHDAAGKPESETQQLLRVYEALACGRRELRQAEQQLAEARQKVIAQVKALIQQHIEDVSDESGLCWKVVPASLLLAKLDALHPDPDLAVLTLDAREQALRRAYDAGIETMIEGSGHSKSIMAEARRLLGLKESSR